MDIVRMVIKEALIKRGYEEHRADFKVMFESALLESACFELSEAEEALNNFYNFVRYELDTNFESEED